MNSYEQMELDTRPRLAAAIQVLASESIYEAQGIIKESRSQTAAEYGTIPSRVRNRHEAYGIAAEQYARIAKAVSSIKGDVSTLLSTLADPNYPAIEATSSIVNSTSEAAAVLIQAAAEMKRTLEDLYTAETAGDNDPTPMEGLADAATFQEAEAVTDGDEETEE